MAGSSRKGIMAMFGKRTVLFVDSILGSPKEGSIELDFPALAERLAGKDYKLVLFKDVLAEIPAEVLAYAFPGIESLDAESVLFRIHSLIPESYGEAGFVWADRSGQHFLGLSLSANQVEEDSFRIDSFIESLKPKEPAKPRMCVEGMLPEVKATKPKRRKAPEPSIDEDISELFNDIRFSMGIAESHEEEAVPEPKLDERTEKILSDIKSLRKKFGLSIDELYTILGYEVKPGPMVISRNGKITLPECGNAEVKMDQLSKAVYFLYLRHPEGIRFKELYERKDELLDIYLSMTVKEDMEAIRRSIDDLVDPTKNSINEKVSRIKAAFRNVVSDHIAKFYYIDGAGGERKKVILNRNLIILDN